MCDPVTITAVTTIASTVYSAKVQGETAEYEKNVAEYNASVKKNEAIRTRNKGVEAENIVRQQAAELQSKQRAQLGAANVGLEFGSAQQLQEDTATLGEADALRIRSNYEQQAESLEQQAEFSRTQGAWAKYLGKKQQIGTVLSGAAKVMDTGVADKWFKPNSQAVVSGGSIGLGPVTSKPSVFNR